MLLLSCLMLSNCGAVTSMPKSEQGISPYDYGLREAKTGEERCYALLRTHKTSVTSGNNVEYSRITSLAKYRRGRTGSISTHGYATLMKWHYKLFHEANGNNAFHSLWLTVWNMVFGVYKKLQYVKKYTI